MRIKSLFWTALMLVAALPLAAQSMAAQGVSSLEAFALGDRVIITFDASGIRSPVLYRSVRPIEGTPDLLGAVIVQMNVSSPFTDYPVPGIPNYYAVIPEEDLVNGRVDIIPGRNATQVPVEASTGDFAFPLALKKPRAFTRDLENSPVGQEEYALRLMVRGPFAARDWETARDELVMFLSLPRSPETEARARFYLGQCYYFLRQSLAGLTEFYAFQDSFPIEAEDWIQALLRMN